MSQFDKWRWQMPWIDEPDNTFDPTLIQYDAYDMQEAYQTGREEGREENDSELVKKCTALENLLAANVRVIKKQIQQEMAEPIVSENSTT